MPLGPEAPFRKRYSLRCPARRVARPPQISVAAGLRIGVRRCARLNPILRNHLSVFPSAPMKEKQGKTRKVPRAHVEWICWEARIRAGEVMPVLRSEVLHSDGLRNLSIECIEDRRACRLLVDVTERIEVPVVVIPKRARCMGAARRSLLRHTLRLIDGRMINARARLKQIAHRRLLLLFG